MSEHISPLMAYRVAAIPDMHTPDHDRRAFGNVCEAISHIGYDEIINLGDILDNPGPSRHNRGKPLLTEGNRLIEDYRTCIKVLEELSQAASNINPDVKRVLIEGNHEARWRRFVEEYPFLDGLCEIEDGLQLHENGWEYVRNHETGKIYKVGNLGFIHGQYCNKHHAAKHLDEYGCSLIYGHTHTTQSFTKSMHGVENALTAWSIGHLGPTRPLWRHSACSKWQHAYADIMVLPDGKFTVTVIHIHEGRFAGPNGRIYGSGASVVCP